MPGTKWTDGEIEFVRNNYTKLTPKKIATELNRTRKAVWHKMQFLGLDKPIPGVGEKYGYLTVLEKYNEYNGRQNRTIAKCKCRCGKECTGILTNIVNGLKLSCGCLGGAHDIKKLIDNNQTNTHGMTYTRIYSIWYGMKTRCTNKKADSRNLYINRGITLCDDWYDFRKFYIWAEQNGYVEGENLSLERIDVNGNYCPENCTWIDPKKQVQNKRCSIKLDIVAFNETKNIYDWVLDKRCVVNFNALLYRIRAGWEPERAITEISQRERKLGLGKWVQRYKPEIVQEYNDFYDK